MFESISQLKQTRRAMQRRRFLSLAVAGVGVYWGYRWWSRRVKPLRPRRTTYLTANRDFFRVSIQPGFQPTLDADGFRLSIRGPAQTEVRLSLEALRALPATRLVRTLICIGNPVGGDSIGNAEWTGVRLGTVLRPVLPVETDDWFVTFHGMDGFYSSLPLAAALDPECYLVYDMNGEPLPPSHGFPLRVLLPGRYGMKQPRWLERIEVSDAATGYWERRGWSKQATIQMTARIDSVQRQNSGAQLIRGIAFCGGEPVGGVEVSLNGGEWRAARLLDATLPGSWSRWELQWPDAPAGEQELAVRVYDQRGRRQTEAASSSYPAGATGLHRVRVSLS